MTIVELCVEGLDGARLAAGAGLDRIEVCTALSEGGLTPSIGTVARILENIDSIGVQVLIRPRPGHFRFDRDEVTVMEADISEIRALHAPESVTVGFVIGALGEDMDLDTSTLRRLLDACGPAPTTLHRCVDLAPDPERVVARAVQLGFTRVLSSGGRATALEGADVLARMVRVAGSAITILAAGGIRPANVAEVVRRSGVQEIHLSAQRILPETTPATLQLTGRPTPNDSAYRPDPQLVHDLVAATPA